MTSYSYKAMWQEECKKVQQLTGEVERLRVAIAASPDENARELERTRLIVDLAGIARHMAVERFTPQQWKQRRHLPPVDFPAIKEPLWYASTIKDRFIVPTGRMWHDFPSEAELSPAA